MTTELQAHQANVSQFNIIRSLTKQIFGSEWVVLDEYQTEDILTFKKAGQLIEALHNLKPHVNPLKRDEELALATLRALMNGEPIPRPPAPAEPDPPIDQLIEPESGSGRHEMPSDPTPGLPVLEPSEMVAKPEPKRIRRGRRLTPIEHGTRRGALAHRRRGEKPCPDCLIGEAEYRNQRKQTNRNGSALEPVQPKPAIPKEASAHPESAKNRAPAPHKPRKTKGVDTPTARSSAHQQSAIKTRAEWEARFHNQAISGLFTLLPATTDEPFPKEAQERWLAFAQLTLNILWP